MLHLNCLACTRTASGYSVYVIRANIACTILAQEDSFLLPQLRTILQPHAFKSLATIFQELEHDHFGQDGMSALMTTLEGIEKELGIYQLEKFTAKV